MPTSPIRHAPPKTGFFSLMLLDGVTVLLPPAPVCPPAKPAAASRAAVRYAEDERSLDTMSPRG